MPTPSSRPLETGTFSSRNKLYGAIATGELRSFLDGKRRMISADALREYIVRRERAIADGEKSGEISKPMSDAKREQLAALNGARKRKTRLERALCEGSSASVASLANRGV